MVHSSVTASGRDYTAAWKSYRRRQRWFGGVGLAAAHIGPDRGPSRTSPDIAAQSEPAAAWPEADTGGVRRNQEGGQGVAGTRRGGCEYQRDERAGLGRGDTGGADDGDDSRLRDGDYEADAVEAANGGAFSRECVQEEEK